MVGYMGTNHKEVPRWAVNITALHKVLEFQAQDPNKALKVFGQLKPKTVQSQFKMSKVF